MVLGCLRILHLHGYVFSSARAGGRVRPEKVMLRRMR